jgi:serine/threonine protein kinase
MNLNSPPPIPQNISIEMKDFINCCLKIEPTERLNVYNLLRHPFITGDIIVNNKKEPSVNFICDINRFNSKLNFFDSNQDEIINNDNSNALMGCYDSKDSESYNKNLNNEFAMK